MFRSAGRDEVGTVTAETAVVLPILVFFTLGMVWLVSLGVTDLRAVDAARETARSVARGDTTSEGISLGRKVAPTGSRFTVESGSETVVVTVKAPMRGTVGIFSFLPRFEVSARAVAAQEPTS
ncbi:MAG: hypothetical protein JWR35_1619 [Marmoricola sp.]|jgi:Flp pilus assembly protein TadG|nr:hypothetical protein [Marmoricola sp.]